MIISKFKPLIQKFPSIERAYRKLAWITYYRDKPRYTPMGFKFSGNKSMSNGSFEPNETRLINSLLLTVDTVINVGANVGYDDATQDPPPSLQPLFL